MDTVFNSVGPYEIVHEIGRGGMATVFLATDTRTGRRVALKLVPAGTDRDARDILEAEQWGTKLQERFSAASRFVPEVYEYGMGGGYFYIAMEYLEGQNLSDLIAGSPLTPARAIGIAIQLCDFLEAAHSFETSIDGRSLRSLVHGDLKPRNIRVRDGDRITVLDFGIAKALSLTRRVTRNDFGTFAYLSPEWFDSGGTIDSHVDLWAVGVLLYEMVAGVQPFVAPDTRRLESRIRSRQPPPPLGAPCPPGLQAVVSKLLAPSLSDRYSDAHAIREDLESLEAGRTPQAEQEGWPTRAAVGAVGNDEPATRRTRADGDRAAETEATRRTLQTATVLLPPPASREPAAGAPAAAAGRSKRRDRLRVFRTVLLVFALVTIFNEYRVGVRAGRLAANVPTRELDEIADAWGEYDRLNGGSLHIGVAGLERALMRQTNSLADRVITNYRSPLPTVREVQWRMAREALAHAATVAPGNASVRASLRYCDGHLHRINGEARKGRKQNPEAQQEFTDAVAAFREAAELRPQWPDPFLGLMRTFIYGLEDVDRGADAFKQAQRLGYVAGDRETVQLADGYRARGDSLVRTAHTLSGLDEEQEYLTRAAEAYREAIDRYSKTLGFGDSPRSLRGTQRALAQVTQRLQELAEPPAQPSKPATDDARELQRWP